MLPPERTATTGVSTFTAPASSAATPTAPGGLDHELAALEQHDHRPGDVLVGNGDDVVDQAC